MRDLFEAYRRSLEPVRELVVRQAPRRPNEDEEAWDRRVRSQYVDTCRFLLPAAALANLGMTANARVLEMSVRKWLSHPLAEVRQIAAQVRAVAQGEVPTLVKYAEAQPYLEETGADLTAAARGIPDAPASDWCALVDHDPAAQERVLAAVLYRFGGMSFEAARQAVRGMDPDGQSALAARLLGRLGRHDIPLRELEHCAYTFDLVMDQGAYFEFKRHRMMTQTPQRLTAGLGYAVPRRMEEAGFADAYRAAMDAAVAAYQTLAGWDPQVAAYLVPNGCNRRVLAVFNLREAYHFCQLRAAANAHFSIRRVALRVAEQIRRVHPLLADGMHLPEETWQAVEAAWFTQV